jgi:hypothetical protein
MTTKGKSRVDEQAREKAAAAVAAYNGRVKAIRADDGLSDMGKRSALEAEFEKAKATTAKLRGDAEKSAERRQQALRRELFGLSYGSSDTAVVSLRDAQDRVTQAKSPEELGELMERAAVTGDESLLRAGFARAWQQGRNPLGSAAKWNGLVDEYAQQRPSVKGQLQELEQLISSAGQTAEFAERMETTPVPPSELRVSA